MRYKMADYEESRRQYKENFDKMCKMDKDHDWYVSEEARLNSRQETIMKALGIFIYNPCPPKTSIACRDCTGFFRATKNTSYLKMCKEIDTGATACFLKWR